MADLFIYENGESEETPSRIFNLSNKRVLIGSSGDNELVLEAQDVDSAHISLELRQTYWVLQDLGSEKGTVLNGQEVNGPCLLEHDDVIEIGQVKIKFQADQFDEGSDTDPILFIEEISGRRWFAQAMGGTLVIIILIILALIASGLLDFSTVFN